MIKFLNFNNFIMKKRVYYLLGDSNALPTIASSGKTKIPFSDGALGTASSRAEQSMPNESTPLKFPSFISIPEGITAPIFATTTFCPASTLGAPQTICKVSSPTFTEQILNLSAFGCFSFVATKPTTNFGEKSTSRLMLAPFFSIAAANCSTNSGVTSTNPLASVCTYWLALNKLNALISPV